MGPRSRRAFLRDALRAWPGLPAAATLLQACGKGSADRRAIRPDGMEDRLAIYNWSDYIDPAVVRAFEAEFGVEVTYDTYESNEEMLAKLQAGATGYDLVVPSGYVVPVLHALDLLAPLDHSLLPNRRHLSPAFDIPAYDPGLIYTMPWQWGTSGIAFRRDLVSGAPTSWGVFHDARYRGRMTQMDDVRDVLGAWLKYRGHSLNTGDPGLLAAAGTDALRAKPLLKSFVSAPVKAQLIAGDVWIAQLWNGDTAQARAEQPALEFATPAEGTMIWADYMAIPKSAPHKRAAHAFLDFVLRPEIGAAISRVTRYGTPNLAAQPLVDDLAMIPTGAELERFEFPLDLGESTGLWDRIWTEVKAG